jgi:pyruvate dehydrogenase E2 component (dihydrolipoamide acetyltransferase)
VTDARAPAATGSEPLPWRRRPPRNAGAFLSPAVRNALAEHHADPHHADPHHADPHHADPHHADPHHADPRHAESRGDEVVPFNNTRRRGAIALLASTRTAPHAFAVVAADYSAIEKARAITGLTALPFMARAVIDALHEFPTLNATATDEALVVHRSVNLGIAVDLDYQGLVVPVIRSAEGMRLRALARAIRERAGQARAKRLGPDDLAGGTFTITNPGAARTWMSFPILNGPQVAILSTDGVAKRVIADSGAGLRIAPVGNLCLAFDHRALDGAYAGAFLGRLREIVEQRDWTAEI